MSIDNLISRLDGVKETGPGKYLARSPAHNDRSPSKNLPSQLPLYSEYAESDPCGYLIKRGTKAGKKRVAHIWTGEDTACRMASTGGLNLSKYLVAANPLHISHRAEKTELPICQMCKSMNERRYVRKNL